MIRKIVACASALALALGVPAAPSRSKTIFPARGGSGDRQDMDICPDGQYLVGLAGRTGSWIDQVRILCAPLGPDGRFGTNAFEGPVRGGAGGTIAEGTCGEGTVLGGLNIDYTEELRQVKFLIGRCFDAGRAEYGGMQLKGTSDKNVELFGVQKQDCPNGELARGMVINSGRHVNAIGLVCDRIVVPAAQAAPPPAPAKRVISSGGRAPDRTAPRGIGQFDLPFESESSLGGKFDVKFQVVGMYKNPSRFHVTGTIVNTDIGPQYNGTFDGTMPMSDTRTVSLTYTQPAANAQGTVVFRFSEDGETFTGDGMHMGHTPFKWTGRRKRGVN